MALQRSLMAATSMSAAVLLPAFLGLSSPANGSPEPLAPWSTNATSGWCPKVRFQVPVASCRRRPGGGHAGTTRYASSPGECFFPCNGQDPRQVPSLQVRSTLRLFDQDPDGSTRESARLKRYGHAHSGASCSAMDLTGIAALVALTGIPVSVLVAHWQKRTALQQTHALNLAARETAEAAHQAALQLQAAQAEAAHESAMAQAAANHQAALELQAAQAAAAHRSAMAQAAASHRSALEVARAQGQVEIERWTREKRSAAFEKVHASLDEFRTAFLQNTDADALARIGRDMHGLFQQSSLSVG